MNKENITFKNLTLKTGNINIDETIDIQFQYEFEIQVEGGSDTSKYNIYANNYFGNEIHNCKDETGSGESTVSKKDISLKANEEGFSSTIIGTTTFKNFHTFNPQNSECFNEWYVQKDPRFQIAAIFNNTDTGFISDYFVEWQSIAGTEIALEENQELPIIIEGKEIIKK